MKEWGWAVEGRGLGGIHPARLNLSPGSLTESGEVFLLSEPAEKTAKWNFHLFIYLFFSSLSANLDWLGFSGGSPANAFLFT